MSAAQYDFTIEQGATFHLRFTWEDSNGAPINLTEFKARMQARKSFNAPEVLIDASTENGLITLNAAAGEVNIDLPESVTSGFSWPQAVYDLELVASNDVVTRLVQGSITISREVTKNA